MFNPDNFEAILKLDDKDLTMLPSAEDDRHEFKSSSTKDSELAEKIVKAASGFWNSGGGLFVAGVNGSGQPDGGISLTVGRQSRRDWIDQAISQVAPRARYVVQCIEDQGAGALIVSGCAVVLIALAASEIGPHMAPDHRYYIRAGAHTIPATHFLVECIWARRHYSKPRIVHVLEAKPFTNMSRFLYIELASVTGSPALDVQIDLVPRPGDGSLKFPLITTLIDGSHNFVFRFEIPNTGFQAKLSVDYTDLVGIRYSYSANIDSAVCVPSWHGGGNQLDEIRDSLERISRSLGH